MDIDSKTDDSTNISDLFDETRIVELVDSIPEHLGIMLYILFVELIFLRHTSQVLVSVKTINVANQQPTD